MCDSILTPPLDRDRILETLLETFRVSGTVLFPSPILAVLSRGKESGLALDMGFHSCSCYPVFQGQLLEETHFQPSRNIYGDSNTFLPIGGFEMTEYLVKILSERGYEMRTTSEREIVKDLKERLCYLALDYDEELDRAEQTGHCEHEYELPDGAKMTVGAERFRCPEILFHPARIGSESAGLGAVVQRCIQSVNDPEIREACSSLVVYGGGSRFEGLGARLAKEIGGEEEVCIPGESKWSAWIGGSIVTSLSSFESMWIRRAEFEEHGSQIFRSKRISRGMKQ